MRITTLSFSDIEYSSASNVDANFFGGNFLFDRDTTTGTFDQKADALNLGLIRYPGGGLAEDHFSLTDPDNDRIENATRKDIVPLSEFIAYAATSEVEYSVVIPTLKYIAAIESGQMNLSEALSELRSFIRDLTSGAYGNNMPALLEIGNEYYTMLGVSQNEASDLYGRLASEFAKVLSDELPLDIKIAVQAGANGGENDIILGHFEGTSARIDTVIVHSYPWTLDQVAEQVEDKVGLANEWIDAGIAESTYLSEWNIGGPLNNFERSITSTTSYERGLAQAAALIELASGYLGAGVEYGAVWPIQQNTANDLGGNEGEVQAGESKLSTSNLTLIGEAYELLSSSLASSWRIETKNIDLDGAREFDRYKDEILIEAFENESEIILFASAWDLSDDQLETVFNVDFGVEITGAEVTTLRSMATNKTDPNGTPHRSTKSYDGVSSTTDITHQFEDEYEIIRVVFKKADTGLVGDLPDVVRMGTDDADLVIGTNRNEDIAALNGDDTVLGNGGNDTIEGSRGADHISGGADDDFIRSAGGNDFVDAGSGNDFVSGGSGSDKILGNAGDDKIRAGCGDDIVKGGKGADSLKGHKGNDRINAGKDDDKVSGGVGDDVIKGGAGDDIIFANRGNDTVNGGSGDDVVRGGQGSDVLRGNNGNDLLSGGGGNDVLLGGRGDDLLTGGGGADRFVFKADEGNATITDFRDGQDLIVFRSGIQFEDLNITSAGNDIAISFAGSSVVLENVSIDEINQQDFLF